MRDRIVAGCRAALGAVALAVLGAGFVVAGTFTNVEIGDGIEVEVLWRGPAGSTALPVADGQSYPYGDTRLIVLIAPDVIQSASPRMELHRARTRPAVHVPETLPDGRLRFEIPFDFAAEVRAVDLRLTLVQPRRPFGVTRDTVARMTFKPDPDSVSVTVVSRYLRLVWDDCPAPCFQTPTALGALTPDHWQEALVVEETDIDGNSRRIERFDVDIRHERPASIVFLVDASGSMLQEEGGDPSRQVLEYLATFPNEAYGGDEVRGLDRLAVMFFDSDVVGYYAGHARGSAAALAPRASFFAPNDLTASWPEFCTEAAPGAMSARFDDAWLLGALHTLRRVGYARGPVGSMLPRQRGCSDGMSPMQILESYRTDVRSCKLDPQCRIRPTKTDVLPALERATEDLEFIRHDAATEGVSANQQAIVLVSDGLDDPFMRFEPAVRTSRYHQIRELLQGRRFFFIDVHSNLVLTKMILEALPYDAPLYTSVCRSLGRHVTDPELVLLLENLLVTPNDEALRLRVAETLLQRPLDLSAPGRPHLRTLVHRVVHESLPLHSAFQQTLAEARSKLDTATRRSPTWRNSIADPWLRELAVATATMSASDLRRTPDSGNLRTNLNKLEANTIEQFRRLALERDGLAVSINHCSWTDEQGQTFEGAVCAFRSILGALRQALRLKYVCDHDRSIRRVKIRLTDRGRALFAAHGLRNARIDRRALSGF